MKKTVSIIKEKEVGERRVIATPREVAAFRDAGYEVFVEEAAGMGIGITDDEYRTAGALVVDTTTAWSVSRWVVKYKPPVESEFQYLNKEKVLCAVFHAEGNKSLVRKLLDSKCTAYTYEFFRTPEGVFPLSVARSEIAGKVAIIYAAYYLQAHLGGSGILLAPVVNIKPPKVLVIGYGNAGGAAARQAAAMGADVTVLGTHREHLRAFQATMPSNTRCLINTSEVLEREIVDADVVIGAILISTYDTPAMVTEAMIKRMKKGSIIVDVTAGYGSGFMPTFTQRTTFDTPVYERFGVLHCKIDTLPLGYPTTTVNAMSQHLMPYIIALGDTIYDPNKTNPTAEAGKIVEAGKIIHAEVQRHFEQADEIFGN